MENKIKKNKYSKARKMSGFEDINCHLFLVLVSFSELLTNSQKLFSICVSMLRVCFPVALMEAI